MSASSVQLVPEIAPTALLGRTFFSGIHLVRVVEIPKTSNRCYIMVEQVETKERWPMTVALACKLIKQCGKDA